MGPGTGRRGLEAPGITKTRGQEGTHGTTEGTTGTEGTGRSRGSSWSDKEVAGPGVPPLPPPQR